MTTITAIDRFVTIQRRITITTVLYDIICTHSNDLYGCGAETLWGEYAELTREGGEGNCDFNDMVRAVNLLIKLGWIVVTFDVNTNINSIRFSPTDRNLRR